MFHHDFSGVSVNGQRIVYQPHYLPTVSQSNYLDWMQSLSVLAKALCSVEDFQKAAAISDLGRNIRLLANNVYKECSQSPSSRRCCIDPMESPKARKNSIPSVLAPEASPVIYIYIYNYEEGSMSGQTTH